MNNEDEKIDISIEEDSSTPALISEPAIAPALAPIIKQSPFAQLRDTVKTIL